MPVKLHPELSGDFSILERAFTRVRADEGTVWLLDKTQTHLVPAWNSGPDAARFVGTHRQPLERGLISLVCISEQPLCENEVYRHAGQDPTLDRALGRLTCAMIAVPLRAGGEMRGVVSCVKLKDASSAAADPEGFGPQDLEHVVSAAHAAGESMGGPPV